MSIQLQLKRNETPFTSKDEARQKLIEQLSSAKAGEMVIATYTLEQQNDPYEYVDLGLPSGLLWAKYNVGATTEGDPGLFFQFGDTQGYTVDQIGDEERQKSFSQDDYKFYVDGEYIKYNSKDGKTVLDMEDDGVRANMGGDWRMPTFEECQELFSETDFYFVPVEGEEIKANNANFASMPMCGWETHIETGTPMKGLRVTKKGDPSTFLYFPANGSYQNITNPFNSVNFWFSYVDANRNQGGRAGSGTGNTVLTTYPYYRGMVLRGVKEI